MVLCLLCEVNLIFCNVMIDFFVSGLVVNSGEVNILWVVGEWLVSMGVMFKVVN